MNELPFRSYRQFMIETYGAPLQRVPIDPGFGCPHRGSDRGGGCTFCPPDGSRAGYTLGAETLEEQIRTGIDFARARYKATKFMAYIQAFTGTFAPASEQRELYLRLLGAFPFDAVSIGTRPDCLPEATLDLLCELKQRLDVWVELGIQTVHDDTLERVNRGHDWETSRDAILALDQRGLNVAVHVIIGLPGEGREHFRETARRLGRLPINGIKIHNLHVVRGAPLAEEFAGAPFPVYDEHEYADILIDFLRRLPAHMPIMRINTDTAEDDLVAPKWGMKKGQFRQYVIDEMKKNGRRQGDLLIYDPPSLKLRRTG
jgi:radical SAM protein (TIGR01212 family)